MAMFWSTRWSFGTVAQREAVRRERGVVVALALQGERLAQIVDAPRRDSPSDLPPVRRLHQDMRS
jgi:hypothetical protein